jgi:uncharacterized protein (TIGR03000 family)
MYTVVLMAAITSGHAATGEWHAKSGCRGCYGCYGGYPGSGYNYMAASGYQSAFSVYAPVAGAGVFGCYGCYGCYGGWSCYGVPLPGHGYWSERPAGTAAPDRSKIEETPLPKEQVPLPKNPTKTELEGRDTNARAHLTIDVPVGATVFLDGQRTNWPAGKREFQTPDLVAGHTYYYDLRVEVVRDGQTLTETRRIVLRPGEFVTAAFPNLHQERAVVPVSTR